MGPENVKAAERVEDMLRLMIDLSKETTHIRPSSMSYQIAIQAWSRSLSPRAPQKVLRLVDEMKSKNIDPDA